MTAALSLEQAPPLSVPLRYFLTAPLFGVAAAVLLFWQGPEIVISRWMPATLALTHLMVLGVLTMVMCGALFQLLPVLAGVRVTHPVRVGGLCHALLVSGSIALAVGFLGGGAVAFGVSIVMLGAAFGLFVFFVGNGVRAAPHRHDSVRGMGHALLALAITAVLGLMLAWGHARHGLPPWRVPLTNLHVAWGLPGWVLVLMAAVAWQVVPMFQMTAEYPAALRRGLTALLVLAVTVLSALSLLAPAWTAVPVGVLALLVGTFALRTLVLLARRRRARGDASLAFWRLSMVSLALTSVAAPLGQMLTGPAGDAAAFFAGVLFIAGAATSVIHGMLCKIVPFLVWLHLQQQLAACPGAIGRFTPPNMHAVLPEPRARIQFMAHALALVLLLAGLFFPALLRPAAVVWLVSFVMLGANLVLAARLYRDAQQRMRASAS